ncbi:MAG TPA: amino acid ABC transporter substrate-binding protein [Candidatus Limnocylindria bacterium]|nr:amino acid ABC transporter substrate-binding protein [Candidatus Limnocylindria bacterium]
MSPRGRRFRPVAALTVASSLLLAACGGGAGSQSAAPSGSAAASGGGGGGTAETLTIGAALPLTGALAPNGKEQHDGYELWKNKVNDQGGFKVGDKTYKVDIKYYDYESDTTTAVKLVEKLITEDKVQALLGPYGSGATVASAAVAEQYGVPMLSPSASAADVFSKGYTFLFGTLVSTPASAKQILDFAKSLSPEPKTIGLITRNDLFPIAQGKAIVDAAQAAGLKVVYNVQFPPDPTDLSTPLLGAKNANPDMLFGLGYVNDLILMTKQAKELGVKPKAFLQTAGPSHYSYIPALKDTANGILTADWWAPQLNYSDGGKLFGKAQDYADDFQKAYNYPPSYVSASATACGYLIQLAMEKAGSIEPDKVREALTKIDDDTFYGHIKFNENGQNIGTPIVIEQIENQKIVTVFPEDVATQKAEYPLQ